MVKFKLCFVFCSFEFIFRSNKYFSNFSTDETLSVRTPKIVLFKIFILDFSASPDNDEPHSPETTSSLRDPFALQPHGKPPHHQALAANNPEENWQSIIQQQHFYTNAQFPSRPLGSITKGSPILSTASSRHLKSSFNKENIR